MPVAQSRGGSRNLAGAGARHGFGIARTEGRVASGARELGGDELTAAAVV